MDESKCPLCGSDAKTWLEPISRNTCVECPSCGHYQITPIAIKYYFDDDLLTPNARLQLITFLQTPGSTRIINAATIREITGIESISIH